MLLFPQLAAAAAAERCCGSIPASHLLAVRTPVVAADAAEPAAPSDAAARIAFCPARAAPPSVRVRRSITSTPRPPRS
jgi:hypothetical protein